MRGLSSIITDRASPSNKLFVDPRNAPSDFAAKCAMVYSDFLTQEEGNLLVEEISKRVSRRRYEKGHWDAVITNYKEIELADDTMDDCRIPEIYERTRRFLEINHLEYQPVKWLPCHGIDLKKDGELNAHVDSIKFSGDLVAGISLKSHCVMRLAPHIDGEEGVMDGHVDLYLPPLSLYVLTGVARYRYSHELLNSATTFHALDRSCISVHRDHRISVIFRDAKRAL